MSSSQNKPPAYFKFLNLLQALREMPTFPAIDATEERLLNQLAAVWGTGNQITVLETMQLDAETSPTTIHRRLKSLRKKGVIQLTVDEIDNRIKYVVPTALAMDYFGQLSNALVKATKGQ